MLTVELMSAKDIELLEKALGCLWAQGELEACEQAAFQRCESALDHASEQSHQSGEPAWLR